MREKPLKLGLSVASSLANKNNNSTHLYNNNLIMNNHDVESFKKCNLNRKF
ncbi:MAG TPA: hypothetical protein VJ697_07085 [Nitrososphaeraceae archaeon]|nr:hypothetical protein [Nitrososphaeraceae archaeon]